MPKRRGEEKGCEERPLWEPIVVAKEIASPPGAGMVIIFEQKRPLAQAVKALLKNIGGASGKDKDKEAAGDATFEVVPEGVIVQTQSIAHTSTLVIRLNAEVRMEGSEGSFRIPLGTLNKILENVDMKYRLMLWIAKDAKTTEEEVNIVPLEDTQGASDFAIKMLEPTEREDVLNMTALRKSGLEFGFALDTHALRKILQGKLAVSADAVVFRIFGVDDIPGSYFLCFDATHTPSRSRNRLGCSCVREQTWPSGELDTRYNLVHRPNVNLPKSDRVTLVLQAGFTLRTLESAVSCIETAQIGLILGGVDEKGNAEFMVLVSKLSDDASSSLLFVLMSRVPDDDDTPLPSPFQ